MKQRITVEQLNELTNEQKERLREWWKPEWYDIYIDKYNTGGAIDNYDKVYGSKGNGYLDPALTECLPLLSIGQMCQFMDEHSPIAYRVAMVQFYAPKVMIPNRDEDADKAELLTHFVNRVELCNYLWEAVKEVLK